MPNEKLLGVAVKSTVGVYDIATVYGPFIHWQACADFMDTCKGYQCTIIPWDNTKAIQGEQIEEFNKPYR